MGSTGIALLLCFLYASLRLTLARSIEGHSNLQAEEQRAIPLKPTTNFQFPKGADDHTVVTHVAGWHTDPSVYYGARAKIGVWGSPDQRHSQGSGTSIFASDGKGRPENMIAAGLHVLPGLYNNNAVHFFTFWTKDGHRSTGCYDLQCAGFVPAQGASLVPGQAVAPLSSYGGADYYITLSLHTDPRTGDWVLYRDDLETPSFLGHFPKELCPELNGNASILAWAGFATYPSNEPGPSMGSGHFPKEGERKAAYFKNLMLFDSHANAYEPNAFHVSPYMDKENCYKVGEFFSAREDGYMFYYGGPSGCTG